MCVNIHVCYIIWKYSWIFKFTVKIFIFSKKSWNIISLSYVIIILILYVIEQSRITFEKWMREMTRTNREIFCFVSSENSYSALQQRHRYVLTIDRPEILVRFIRAKFSGWPRLKRLHWPFSSFDILHIRYILYILYYGQSEPENANIRVSHIGFTIFTIGFITRSRCARTNAVTAEFQLVRIARQELTA